MMTSRAAYDPMKPFAYSTPNRPEYICANTKWTVLRALLDGDMDAADVADRAGISLAEMHRWLWTAGDSDLGTLAVLAFAIGREITVSTTPIRDMAG